MAYVIIKEKLQDQQFLDTYTTGFERYQGYVMGKEDGQPKTPTWAESISAIPAATIERLAREYAITKPAAFLAGIAPGRTAYGEQYHRAASVLAAMTGNVGVKGGNAAGRIWESIVGGFPYKIKTGVGVYPEDGFNPVDEAAPPPPPGANSGYRSSRVHYLDLPDLILKGKEGGFPADCKMIYIVNTNYVNQHPDINKIVKALNSQRLEFIAVQEQFMTATAKFADILLPTTTFFERNDINNGAGILHYGYVNKVIEPLGECKSHLEIAELLADRLGIDNFGSSVDTDWLEKAAEDSEIPDYEKFKKEAVYKFPLSDPYVRFREQIENPRNNPFPTPSGKIEIYSQKWADLNNPEIPPTPKYIETWENLNDPLAQTYPLQLITTHFKRRALSQYDNLGWLKKLQRQALMINSIDAQERGIKDGDIVRAFNNRGETLVPAWVTERIMPGVVDLPHGAWYDPDEMGRDRAGSANVLTRSKTSPGGGFTYNTALVQVEKFSD
jgi:anaerobic dimethyl sulfoxide reductase subunit A